MPRPTIVEQIAKAAEAGDLEKVKELSKKLASKEKVKPKVRAKAKTEPKKKKEKQIEEEYDVYEEEATDDEDEIDESNGFIAKARRSNHYGENSDSEEYTDEDGESRTRCRKVPFKVLKNRKNKWADNLNEYKEDAELDKKLHKNGVNRGNGREVVKKIKIKCKQCGNSKIMWPGEVKHSNWICDDCIIGSIRRD